MLMRTVKALPFTEQGISAALMLYTTLDAPKRNGSFSGYSIGWMLNAAIFFFRSLYQSRPPTHREQAVSNVSLPPDSLSRSSTLM